MIPASQFKWRINMKENKTRISPAPSSWSYESITLAGCLLLSGFASGQELPANVAAPLPQLPAALGIPANTQFTPAYDGKAGTPQQAIASSAPAVPASYSEPLIAPARRAAHHAAGGAAEGRRSCGRQPHGAPRPAPSRNGQADSARHTIHFLPSDRFRLRELSLQQIHGAAA